jgi:hypothetical protein
MLDQLINVSSQPAAYFITLSIAALISFIVIPVILLTGGLLISLLGRVLFFPVHLYLIRFSGSDLGTHVTQPVVAAIFFCFFTSRISAQHRFTTFIAISILIVVLALIVFRLRARYRPYYSEVLFDQRFIYPALEAFSAQRRLLGVIGGILPLRFLVWAIQVLANQIHHRQWQLFFGTLAVFSFYTLPVQLFPGLDRFLIGSFQAIVEKENLLWMEQSPVLGKPLQIAGAGFLYLFDWCVTVLGVYAMILLFAPLEPRNTFNKVGDALRDFVRKGKIFVFTGFFWQNGAGSSNPATCVRDKERSDLFEAAAKAIHNETLVLDNALKGTWQGVSCRVALVYEPSPTSVSKVRNPYCFHYRRLGKSSFLVAADANGRRFDGTNARSQNMFYQLAESITHLVNVGHSLK